MMPDEEDEEALEVPDIFDLHPLFTQRITLHIRQVRPAVFYYVSDIDDLDERTEECEGDSCHKP